MCENITISIFDLSHIVSTHPLGVKAPAELRTRCWGLFTHAHVAVITRHYSCRESNQRGCDKRKNFRNQRQFYASSVPKYTEEERRGGVTARWVWDSFCQPDWSRRSSRRGGSCQSNSMPAPTDRPVKNRKTVAGGISSVIGSRRSANFLFGVFNWKNSFFPLDFDLIVGGFRISSIGLLKCHSKSRTLTKSN